MTTFTVRIPLPSRDVAQNARGHWSNLARATRAERRRAFWHFREGKPRDWQPQAVRIEVIYHAPLGSPGYCPRDSQNAIGALKAAIDGMVDAGICPDDSAKWLSWGEFRLTREPGAAPGVYVTVVGAAAQGSEPTREGGSHGRAEAVGEGAGDHAGDEAAA